MASLAIGIASSHHAYLLVLFFEHAPPWRDEAASIIPGNTFLTLCLLYFQHVVTDNMEHHKN